MTVWTAVSEENNQFTKLLSRTEKGTRYDVIVILMTIVNEKLFGEIVSGTVRLPSDADKLNEEQLAVDALIKAYEMNVDSIRVFNVFSIEDIQTVLKHHLKVL